MNYSAMNRVLIVIASSAGASARDGVDAALAAIAYEHPVAVLLIGDGVGLAIPHQRPEQHGLPDLTRALAALIHHGVEAIWVSQNCLSLRGIADIAIVARRLEAKEIPVVISEFRHVIRF
jgi:tRNA 2-thiouridine synthesizing protein C